MREYTDFGCTVGKVFELVETKTILVLFVLFCFIFFEAGEQNIVSDYLISYIFYFSESQKGSNFYF